MGGGGRMWARYVWGGVRVGVFGLNINNKQTYLSFKTQICNLRDNMLRRKKLFHVS